MDLEYIIRNKDNEIIVEDYTGPFIYLLFNKNELVYVGKSLNVIYRIGTHLSKYETDMNFEFDKVIMKKVPRLELDGIERKLIVENKPKYNIFYLTKMGNNNYWTRHEKPINLNQSQEFIDTLRRDWGNIRADLLIKYIKTDKIDKEDEPHRPQILADYKRLKRRIKINLRKNHKNH
jgi:hypothetical protein